LGGGTDEEKDVLTDSPKYGKFCEGGGQAPVWFQLKSPISVKGMMEGKLQRRSQVITFNPNASVVIPERGRRKGGITLAEEDLKAVQLYPLSLRGNSGYQVTKGEKKTKGGKLSSNKNSGIRTTILRRGCGCICC